MRLTPDSAFQLDWQSWVGIGITLMVSAFANASGIGGGAFLVPLFNVLLGFALKASTALSQAVITAGVLAGVALNSQRHHPKDLTSCIISFDLVLLFTPVLLLGVSTGVLFNVMFPDWLITIILVVLIGFLTLRTSEKGSGMWRAETRKKLDRSMSPTFPSVDDDRQQAATDAQMPAQQTGGELPRVENGVGFETGIGIEIDLDAA